MKNRWKYSIYGFSFLLALSIPLEMIFVVLWKSSFLTKILDISNFIPVLSRLFLFTNENVTFVQLSAGICISVFMAILITMPFGWMSAVFLNEFVGRTYRRFVAGIFEILASVPTIVYGFGLILTLDQIILDMTDTYFGSSMLTGVIIGLMTLPLSCSLMSKAMNRVAPELKEAAYALGASKTQIAGSVLFPASRRFIGVAFILGLSRAIGEIVIVAIIAGLVPYTARAIIVLIILIFLLNGVAVYLKNKDKAVGFDY